MFQSLDLDQRAYADRTFCSWKRGWRSLLLRRFTNHADVEDVTVPPVAEQTIVLSLRGTAMAESNAGGRWRPAQLGPGNLSMTAPNWSSRLRWRALSPEPLESLHLYLPAETTTRLIEDLWDCDPNRIRLPDKLAASDPVLEQTMLGLLRAAEEDTPDLYAETAVEFITVHTLVRHCAMPSPRSFGGDDARVRRARAFLRENLHRSLSLAEIAAEAGMSRYHFLRVFQSQTGETPHRYLTRIRIEHGRDALKHGSATVSEIAGQCGFASPAHFATAFRRETGVTPSAYRALHRI